MPVSVPDFLHLRVCSMYSPLEGAIRIPQLIELCQRHRMPAVGITDRENLFGALDFSVAALAAGVQPILGCAIGLGLEDKASRSPPLVLYAQTETGWRNLLRLVSGLYVDSPTGHCCLSLDDLAKASRELICLTGGAFGPVGALLRSQKKQAARRLLDDLAAIFGDCLYVELQRHRTDAGDRLPAEAETEAAFIRFAYDAKLPLVATNEACFPKPEFFDAHKTLVSIRVAGERIGDEYYTPDHCFASADEMRQRFKDLPEALARTFEVAQRCAFWPVASSPQLPRLAENEVELLYRKVREGLKVRLKQIQLAKPETAYYQRIEYELDIIKKMGFAGYFLIVEDFVSWARENGIPVGPGRGSGAGSLAAYALCITDLDPLRYGLLFERFLNPERVSMPDFDIDFCEHRREEVVRYVRERYSPDRVAKILSLNLLKSRAVIRDVGRVLGIRYSETDRIAKLIPQNPADPMSLTRTMKEVPEFREAIESNEQTWELYDKACRIEDLPRNVSIHAAGLVIANRPIIETVPLYKDTRSDMPATQFTMNWVEKAGLVKFDLLGLKTLTALQETVDFLAERGKSIDLSLLPLDDQPTFELYRRAETTGVFQVESEGMRNALRDILPDRFDELIALVALYRPGPISNIASFSARKRGEQSSESFGGGKIASMMEPILRETYGIIVYQEQVMEIVRLLAGFSLGQADNVRRAMGKKKKDEMQAMREAVVTGLCRTCDVKTAEADRVYDDIEKFAGYGFNKSHAAAYALISYQTAYLKQHYPVEFLTATMNAEMGGQDRKLAEYCYEAQRLGISVRPPCINHSGPRFCPADGAILYALGAIKGASVASTDRIVRERAANGSYRSLCDLACRIDLTEVGKGTLEKLAEAGAFDTLNPNRRQVFEAVPMLIHYSRATKSTEKSAGVSLFGEEELRISEPTMPELEDYPLMERFARERQAVGFLLSGHPLENYSMELRAKDIRFCSEITESESSDKSQLVAGVIEAVDRRRSQKGNFYLHLQVSDPQGRQNVFVYEQSLGACKDMLTKGASVVLDVEWKQDRNSRRGRVICNRVYRLEDSLNQHGMLPPSLLRLSIASGSVASVIADLLRLANREDSMARRFRIQLRLQISEIQRQIDIDIPGDYPFTQHRRMRLNDIPGILAIQEISQQEEFL